MTIAQIIANAQRHADNGGPDAAIRILMAAHRAAGSKRTAQAYDDAAYSIAVASGLRYTINGETYSVSDPRA